MRDWISTSAQYSGSELCLRSPAFGDQRMRDNITAARNTPVPAPESTGMTPPLPRSLTDPQASVPVPPQNPKIPELMQQKAHLSQPIDRQDPKYRMGFGQRLLGFSRMLLQDFPRMGKALLSTWIPER